MMPALSPPVRFDSNVMAERLSIIIVLNGLGVGGAERQVLALLPALMERGHRVALVTINDDMRLEAGLPSGVKHYPLHAKKWSGFARVIFDFWKIVRRERPNIIHGHLFQANLLSRIGKMYDRRIRVINTSHCSYPLERLRYDPYLIYGWTKRLVDWHTAVSHPALVELRARRSISPERSCLLFNAIDVDRYKLARPGCDPVRNSATRVFRWIAVGRLSPVKNYGLLLQAVSALNRDGCRLTLDVAGEGAQLAELQRHVSEYGLDQSVRFLGLVHDVPSRLAAYDGYVISSDNEALPMALLEAMAAGLPVVGTRVGEIARLLERSKGGITVEPGNATELACALAAVMRLNTSELVGMGMRNRALVGSTFGIARIVAAWERIYLRAHMAGNKALNLSEQRGVATDLQSD